MRALASSFPRASIERAPAGSRSPRSREAAARIAAPRRGRALAGSSPRASLLEQPRARASLPRKSSQGRGRCSDRSVTLCARIGKLVSSSQPFRASLERAPACSRSHRWCESAARIAAMRWSTGRAHKFEQHQTRASLFQKSSLWRGRCDARSATLIARGCARRIEPAAVRVPACS
jgi:hypothetical protein